MITEREKIKARKKLHNMARSYKRKGRPPHTFKRFINEKWPTVYNRVSEKELQHLIDLVWSDWYNDDILSWTRGII